MRSLAPTTRDAARGLIIGLTSASARPPVTDHATKPAPVVFRKLRRVAEGLFMEAFFRAMANERPSPRLESRTPTDAP